jgi:ABC-type nitrate/sulfonate/bicarbonate transport system permease component
VGAKASFSGITLILGICFILWLAFNQSLKEMFLFSSPKEVLKAEYQLFVTGIQGMQVAAFNGQTEWRDVGVSLLEVLGGIGLAGGVGFAVAKALEKAPSVPKTIWSHLLCLTYITPIALWQALLPWVGLGISHKIVLIACLTFFPVVETLWIFRETPVLVRIAIAIDEALPLAFVGMILGELWAATAGIGFFIVVTKATSHFAESTAMSLFGFAILVAIFIRSQVCS